MNLGRRQDGASARLTAPRPILICLLVACAALAVPATVAMSTGRASTGSSTAKPLWREYPLEQTATTGAAFALQSTRSTEHASETPATGRRTPWIVFLLTGVALALTAATAVVLRRNSAADRAPAVFFNERTWRAAAAAGAELPTNNPAGRKPQRHRRRGAVVPERSASEGDQARAEAARRPRAFAGTDRALTHSDEATDSTTAETEQTAVAPAVAEHSADTASVSPAVPNAALSPHAERSAEKAPTPAAPDVGPATPEQSPAAPQATREPPRAQPEPQHETQADAEPAPTATPSRGAGRDPQSEGSRGSAAQRARPRQRPGASRSGAPPPRPATSDDAARAATSRRGQRRDNPAAATAAQGARADSAAAERDKSRPGPAVRGPICQIRWSPTGRGSCFSAVTTDAGGVERTVATSPPVEWHRATPPEQNPEARAALRQLSKTLRDKGWRPMRAKGKDFNEPQWYARRFRGPEAPTRDHGPGVTERGGSAP